MLVRPFSRPGLTLLEVLAAIFIMGVGLLALFTLFPLGALSMARAVRDDRATAIAANASALAAIVDLRNDLDVVLALTATPILDQTLPIQNPARFASPPDPLGQGYPVLVDPKYVNLGAGNLGYTQGVTPGIQRIAPAYVKKNGAIDTTRVARWFTFLDEITFVKTGAPKVDTTVTPSYLERPGTYTCTYLVRRPKMNVPDLVEMSVLIYANRASELAEGETTFLNVNTTPPPTLKVLGTAGTNTITFDYATKPNIRKGWWILDVTYNGTIPTTNPPAGYGSVNAHPYRVESVQDTGANQITLEVDPPLKANVNTFVLLENVIAVVDRSTTWKP